MVVFISENLYFKLLKPFSVHLECVYSEYSETNKSENEYTWWNKPAKKKPLNNSYNYLFLNFYLLFSRFQ